MKRIVGLTLAPFMVMGCGNVSNAEDPAPGFGRVQAIIDAKDRNDPIPRLRLSTSGPVRKDKKARTEAEWKRTLSAAQYAVLRGRGTEEPNSSPLLKEHGRGEFACAACGNRLFSSKAKFDSGTGWPSFVEPASKDAVWYRLDRSGGLHRVEVLCAKCDGHLGHVFDDGPANRGGLRYCIDGTTMRFVSEKRSGLDGRNETPRGGVE